MSTSMEMPIALKALSLAVAAGLLAGAVFGVLGGSTQEQKFQSEWTPLPPIRTVEPDVVRRILASSPVWARPQESAEEATQLVTIEGKPGVLAYLSVLAIITEPSPAALLRIATVPDSLRDELALSPDSEGLATVAPGDTVASGWVVDQISSTSISLSSLNTSDDGGQDTVEYGLF